MKENRRILNAVEKWKALRYHYSKSKWIEYEVAVDRLSLAEYDKFCEIIDNMKGAEKK